jgi:hypothetical protein
MSTAPIGQRELTMLLVEAMNLKYGRDNYRQFFNGWLVWDRVGGWRFTTDPLGFKKGSV